MVDEPGASSGLESELASLLNKHSAENPSGTPDFILAAYLTGCLDVFNKTVIHRGHWRGEPAELSIPISLDGPSPTAELNEPKDTLVPDKTGNRFERYMRGDLGG